MSENLLKLFATDAEDIQIIAAILQDAIAPVSEMAFRKEEKSFVMVVQRFRWDCLRDCGEGTQKTDKKRFERVNAAVDVEDVSSVKYAGFDPENQSLMLDLLTLKGEGKGLNFVFAGSGELYLGLGLNWRLRLEDFGEPWPTTRLPSHQA
jgi:hypothetical protein